MTAVALDPGAEFLLRSHEPVIRYRALLELIGAAESDERVAEARATIPSGPIVPALLAGQPDRHPYSKWTGAHWRLVSLMDLGVPGDLPGVREALEPVFDWVTGRGHRSNVPVINGLARRWASQEGNVLAVAVHFGLADDPRTQLLAGSLVGWQWPDGVAGRRHVRTRRCPLPTARNVFVARRCRRLGGWRQRQAERTDHPLRSGRPRGGGAWALAADLIL